MEIEFKKFLDKEIFKILRKNKKINSESINKIYLDISNLKKDFFFKYKIYSNFSTFCKVFLEKLEKIEKKKNLKKKIIFFTKNNLFYFSLFKNNLFLSEEKIQFLKGKIIRIEPPAILFTYLVYFCDNCGEEEILESKKAWEFQISENKYCFSENCKKKKKLKELNLKKSIYVDIERILVELNENMNLEVILFENNFKKIDLGKKIFFIGKNNIIERDKNYTNLFFCHEIIEKKIEKRKEKSNFLEKNYEFFFKNLISNKNIKLGIILSLIGGECKNFKFRGDIHLLICGENYTGKCVGGEEILEIKIDREKRKIKFKKLYYGFLKNKNLKIEILSYNFIKKKKEFRLIKGIFRKKFNSYLEINFEKGKKIISSENHKFFTPFGWKESKFLFEGEILMNKFKIIKINKIKKKKYLYDLQVEGNKNYFFSEILGHNSLIVKEIEKFNIGEIISGEGSTKAGLTVSTIKEEYSKSFYFTPGSFVRNNLGYVIMDDIQNLENIDRSVLYTVLEKQILSISKGGKNQTFNSKCTFISTYLLKGKKIYLPDPILNRFDLILSLKRLINEEEIKKYINLKIDQINEGKKEFLTNFEKLFLENIFLAKEVDVEFTEDNLKEFNKKLLEKIEERGNIDLRKIESLKRLILAYSKFKFSKKIDSKKINFIIDWYFNNHFFFKR